MLTSSPPTSGSTRPRIVRSAVHAFHVYKARAALQPSLQLANFQSPFLPQLPSDSPPSNSISWPSSAPSCLYCRLSEKSPVFMPNTKKTPFWSRDQLSTPTQFQSQTCAKHMGPSSVCKGAKHRHSYSIAIPETWKAPTADLTI